MKLSSQIKPISYLKSHAADIVRNMREPLVITQNGEAKVVIQDVHSYEKTQETMAMLKLLALGNKQIEEGKVVLAEDALLIADGRRDMQQLLERRLLGG
ncbi:MAG: antitoxin, Phd family protein [Proteobacteria bacterium]|nr:MAG: antitoxin, Phd family protein [Pseudomonadota bacterium]